MEDYKLLFDIIGWSGSVGLLLAYGLNSYQKIKSDSYTFLLLNLFSGIFLIAYTIFYKTYANTFLNIVWVIIAVPAIIRLARQKNKGI
jgi:uncharacterized membrane protein